MAGEIAHEGLGAEGFEFAGAGVTMLDVDKGPAFGPAAQLRPRSHEAATDRPQASVSFAKVVEQGRSDQIPPIGPTGCHKSCTTQSMSLICHRLVEECLNFWGSKPFLHLDSFIPCQWSGSQNIKQPGGQVTPAGLSHRPWPRGQERFDLQSTQ
jgi:hypothetical protein